MPLNCGAREDLRIPWTERRSNQSMLREINPEYSLGGLDVKIQIIGKDPDAGRGCQQEEKGVTEDEMVG